MADLEMFCGECDEPIQVKPFEDANRAYAHHCQTTYHVEVAERLRSIKLGNNSASSSHSYSSFGDAAQHETAMQVNCIKSFALFTCKICQMDVNDSAAMTQHMNSQKHEMLETFVKQVNCQRELLKLMGFFRTQPFQAESDEILSYFSNMDARGTRVCLVCNRNVAADRNHLLQHARNDDHLINLNSLFMNWGEDETFYCIICNIKNEKGATEHCYGDMHRSAINLLFEFARNGMF